MKKLPKYFVIKRDLKNPLWKKYIHWIGEESGNYWSGDSYTYYGFDGSNDFDGVVCHDRLEEFDNSPIVITLEQWDKYVKDSKPISIGDSIIVTKKLVRHRLFVRDYRQPNRIWKEVEIPPIKCFIVGVRSISNGRAIWEEGSSSYTTHTSRKAYLVAKDIYSKPFYTPIP